MHFALNIKKVDYAQMTKRQQQDNFKPTKLWARSLKTYYVPFRMVLGNLGLQSQSVLP